MSTSSQSFSKLPVSSGGVSVGSALEIETMQREINTPNAVLHVERSGNYTTVTVGAGDAPDAVYVIKDSPFCAPMSSGDAVSLAVRYSCRDYRHNHADGHKIAMRGAGHPAPVLWSRLKLASKTLVA